MDIYRIPRREVPVQILLDDGRSLNGTLFTAVTGPEGRPEDVLHHLNDVGDDFVPLVCGRDSFLLNKAGIIWVQVAGGPAREIGADTASAQRISARVTLAGGVSVVGTLAIVMPPERSRAVDYLNAAGRFLPLFGEDGVTLVQRRFVVTVRSAEDAEHN
jgi:hypothetical protein